VDEPLLIEREVALSPLLEGGVDLFGLGGIKREDRHSFPPGDTHGLRSQQTAACRVNTILECTNELVRRSR